MPVDLALRVPVGSLGPQRDGAEVVIAGWLEDVRDLGGIAFARLRDATGIAQVVLPKKKVTPEILDAFLKVHRESALALRGTVKASEKALAGFEVLPAEVQILNPSGAPLPLPVADPVEAELDTRLDHRFLDLRKPPIQAIFRIRHAMIQAARTHLVQGGFVEVHTPNIIATASEGGTELFGVKYFERDAYLSQSPQLYKQMLMATGLDRVFELARYFRAEPHNTPRHLNESTAVDVELAWIRNEDDVMQVLENLVSAIWRGAVEGGSTWLDRRSVRPEIPEPPFPRVTYDRAIEVAKDAGIDVQWGQDLPREAEKALGEAMATDGRAFYFITRYPAAAKPFYAMPDGEYSRSFDLAHLGMEITSGAQRVHDPVLLESRLKEKGLDPASFGAYLEAFRYGMPPHGGFGLGIERVLTEMLHLGNVREAILFPRDRNRIAP